MKKEIKTGIVALAGLITGVVIGAKSEKVQNCINGVPGKVRNVFNSVKKFFGGNGAKSEETGLVVEQPVEAPEAEEQDFDPVG